MVTQQELERRTARSAANRARAGPNVNGLRDAEAPRKERDRVFDRYDQRYIDQQRQMDELERAQGSVYSPRDVV
jgi:hypothetical protein